MSDMVGKIITGVITAFATLLVCLINNYYVGKRHREDMEENSKKRIEEMNQKHTQNLQEFKEEMVAQMGEVVSSFSSLSNSVDLIKYKIDDLTSKVNKHNNVIERTYELEKNASIQEEQIKVANNRIADLEELARR